MSESQPQSPTPEGQPDEPVPVESPCTICGTPISWASSFTMKIIPLTQGWCQVRPSGAWRGTNTGSFSRELLRGVLNTGCNGRTRLAWLAFLLRLGVCPICL